MSSELLTSPSHRVDIWRILSAELTTTFKSDRISFHWDAICKSSIRLINFASEISPGRVNTDSNLVTSPSIRAAMAAKSLTGNLEKHPLDLAPISNTGEQRKFILFAFVRIRLMAVLLVKSQISSVRFVACGLRVHPYSACAVRGGEEGGREEEGREGKDLGDFAYVYGVQTVG